MTALAAIYRRELAAYFYAPIAYVVGVLFLVLQGLSFWAVVEVLSDPGRPAGYGAVLGTHFGGTPLYWAVLFAVVAVIAMRLVADEKRQGTWESLLTAPVSEDVVLAAKWLAACTFYAILWLPTVAYVFVLNVYAPGSGGVDGGPIASAYLGVALSGSAFLAIGLAASCATANQIIAAAATFALLWGLLLVGQIPDILGIEQTGLWQLIDLRGHMSWFARGELRLESIVLFVSLGATGFAAANRLATARRFSNPRNRRRSIALVLVAINAAFAIALATRVSWSWDVSASGQNALDDRTAAVLAEVGEPIDVLVVRPTADVDLFADVFAQADRLLAQMVRKQPLLRRRNVDPLRETERLSQLAREFAIAPGDLAEGGAVVFARGSRRRAIDLLDMAEFSRDELGVGALDRFRAEEAFATAISELVELEPVTVCATSGHGELSLFHFEGETPNWRPVAERLRNDWLTVRDIGTVGRGVPADCRALIIAGPAAAFLPDEALAVNSFLSRGGRVLLAVRSLVEVGESSLPPTGLADVLAEHGIAIRAAVAVDPRAEINMPLAWATATGYGDHPISAAFAGRRLTVWLAPWVVTGPSVLVSASELGWGEIDLDALLGGREVGAGEGEILGAPPIAVASRDATTGARIVVFGSSLSPSSQIAGRGLGNADALVMSAVRWLTERTLAIEIGDKTPEHVRLVMTRGQQTTTFALCVVLLPLMFAGTGAVVAWRRKRG